MRNALPLSLTDFRSGTPLTLNPSTIIEVSHSVPFYNFQGSLVACREEQAERWACVVKVRGDTTHLVEGTNEVVTAKWRACLTGLDKPAERLLNATATMLGALARGQGVPCDPLNPMLDPVWAEVVEASKAVRLALP